MEVQAAKNDGRNKKDLGGMCPFDVPILPSPLGVSPFLHQRFCMGARINSQSWNYYQTWCSYDRNIADFMAQIFSFPMWSWPTERTHTWRLGPHQIRQQGTPAFNMVAGVLPNAADPVSCRELRGHLGFIWLIVKKVSPLLAWLWSLEAHHSLDGVVISNQ